MAKKGSVVDDWIQGYLRDEAPRSKSLMISAFGDSIAPYADGVWLGDFIELVAPLGLGERLVRTSAFRLIEEGWLRARREGRRSYYTLTATGVRRFEAAYTHIYRPPQEQWDGNWTLVLLPRNEDNPSQRIELKRELEWEGFASMSTALMLHPGISPAEAQAIVDRNASQDHVVVMQSRTLGEGTSLKASELLTKCWDLADVEDRYARFLSRFNPLMTRLDAVTLSAAQAFQIQTLLIHSFRRASLHDPRLPTSMLPPDWLGLRAFRLCRDLYARTYLLTRQHLKSLPEFEIADMQGARLKMAVDLRFGGIASTAVEA